MTTPACDSSARPSCVPVEKRNIGAPTNPRIDTSQKKINAAMGLFCLLFRVGLAELNTDTRYQGDDKSCEGSVFCCAHGVYVLVR